MDTEQGLGELLGTMLENPKLMQGLLGMLGSLGGSDDARGEQEQSNLGREASKQQGSEDGARRRALLLALKPYFRPERAEKVELVLKLLEIMELLHRTAPPSKQMLTSAASRDAETEGEGS